MPLGERLGAISLSTSNHFPPIAVSKFWKPVIFPPGRAKFVTKAASNRIGNR